MVAVRLTVLLLLVGLGWASARSGAATTDIVLYAADATSVSGVWSKVSASGAAGGVMLSTPDRGWSAADVPLVSPTDYFEIAFDASAATTYQLWVRMRGAADSKWNESVWVQFDNAVDGSGNALWRIGSASALAVNLENCTNCGIAGWGWQDNAWWTGQTARVRFPTAGPQTIRIQVREDGVAIDQIVLSPTTWLSTPPGALRNDATIVPKPATSPTITLVRHPYVQQVTSSSAIVVWTTRQNGIADVRYATSGVNGVAPARSRLVAATSTGMPFDYHQHEAALTGLSASTAYAYTPTVDGVAISTDRFVTAPPVGTGTVRFIVFGDSGVGSTEQRQLAARMNADTFDFALHTGDVAYGTAAPAGAGDYPQLHSWFFDIYRDWLRRRPFYPSIGNHDDEARRAAPFRDVFVLPSNGATSAYPDHARRFYSFDYGPAHVVVLDTGLAFQDLARRAAQLEWLKADLAATTQPWKIAVSHRAPYSAGAEHGSDLAVRAAFGPIFDEYGVALALSGHEHDYERSVPIRETADGSPVVYVVTGGGGAKLYPAGSGWWTAMSRSVFHYVRGSVTPCVIFLEAIGLDGIAFDSTTLDRCAAAPPPQPPTAATTPYGGSAAVIPGVIQAEHFDDGGKGLAYLDSTSGNAGGRLRATDVDIQPSYDVGGGYNLGWTTAGEWLVYTADVPQTRTYTVSVRVASYGQGGTFHLEAGGVDVTGPMTIPNTGAWQKWVTVTRPGVTLAAGRQPLRLVLDTNGPTGAFGNINYILITQP